MRLLHVAQHVAQHLALPVALAACLTVPAAAQGTPSAQDPARTGAPVVGQPFGPLLLPTVDRSQVLSLDSFAGRKLLLLEFASW